MDDKKRSMVQLKGGVTHGGTRSEEVGDLVNNEGVTGWKLGDAIIYLLGNCHQPSLSVATAYFNLGALKVLESVLPKVNRVRLLVGKEQEQPFILTQKLFEGVQRSLSKAEENPQEVQKRVKFLTRENVEIRVCREGFLHGMAYLLEGEGISPAGAVGFVGSSNFRRMHGRH